MFSFCSDLRNVLLQVGPITRLFKTQHRDLYAQVSKLTSFLPATATPTRRVFHIVNNLPSIPVCKQCHVELCFWNKNTNQYSSVCSKKCSRAYGELSKREATCMERYGVSNPRSSEVVKQTIRETMINRYGASNYFKCNLFEEQRRLLLNAANKVNISQNHIPEQSIALLNDPEWCKEQYMTQQLSAAEIAAKLGYRDVSTIWKYLRQHGIEPIHHTSSRAEREIGQYLTELGIDFFTNVRGVIGRKELDIYIPSHRLAIEFCGLYWHNELSKDRLYHKQKRDLADQAGIQLLTVFEDEWSNKQPIVKRMIAHRMKMSTDDRIYARNTTIREIDCNMRKQFLISNHIQGDAKSTVQYGLFVGDTLVAVCALIVKGAMAELVRYSTSTTVVGGLSKLLAHAWKQLPEIKAITTFADLRWSNGMLYKQTGFTQLGTIPPDYYYCIDNQRYHKFNFRHKHLKKKLKTYDPKLSEVKNCHANKIYRIFDCGKQKYVLTRPCQLMTRGISGN